MLEKWSQSALPPLGPWGRAGWGVGIWGGAQPHFLSLPPLATSLSVLVFDFTAPDPELTLRHLSDGVYRLSSPEAGLLERGLWLTSHGFKMGSPHNRSPDICFKEGRGRKGERRKGGSKGWIHGVGRDFLLVQRLRLCPPHAGAQVRPLFGELDLACTPQLDPHAMTKKPARHK